MGDNSLQSKKSSFQILIFCAFSLLVEVNFSNIKITNHFNKTANKFAVSDREKKIIKIHIVN